MTARHTLIDSPVGPLLLTADEDAVTGLYFQPHRHPPADGSLGERTSEGFDDVARQLAEYFSGERREFDLLLEPAGNDFQKKVWLLLREIPYGETRSYGQLATTLGDINLARAVGTANGRNPISIIVPCHRVIGADGNLTGYGGGLDRKRFLLQLEEPPNENRLF
ncbi:methylated-DNA--[protein]-cysteine S-methyltransferase [Homoserinimonas sp. OAct 916]|uniref:methylated-DNA--[protein]-cysteine S-methyltransferase n=1 Tax=Homoserinimonas sp. OAct 916 TaxID=2211450 RepID=UPI000DBE9EE8|nr:methylated-DNA--[protein]-cysteine S-methyltransferase [Homoserinimonas sp. OAct 916]